MRVYRTIKDKHNQRVSCHHKKNDYHFVVRNGRSIIFSMEVWVNLSRADEIFDALCVIFIDEKLWKEHTQRSKVNEGGGLWQNR